MPVDQQAPKRIVITTPGDREVQLERIFDAPRDAVWRAFVDPELIVQWWGPRGTTTEIDHIDVRPGGDWRMIIRGEDGHGQVFRGTFREIRPPSLLERTFEWEGMPGHVAVETVTFEDLGDGRTRLVARSIFHTTAERDQMLTSGGMERGANDSYDRLEELVATV